MRMRATNFAFTRSRTALITEGPSDYLWLPRLFAEADTSVDRPEFQVVPGLSVIKPENVAELDAEAGRVAYLVDGDDGGRDNHAKLIRAGIDASRVIALPVASIDDLVSAPLLASATGVSAGKVDVAEFAVELAEENGDPLLNPDSRNGTVEVLRSIREAVLSGSSHD